MNRYWLCALLLAFVAGCDTSGGVREGASVGSQAIVVGRITVLGRSPASLITVKPESVLLPAALFKTEAQETFIVERVAPATYGWGRGRMVAWPRDLELSGALRPFVARSGCISYFGDITIDLQGAEPRVTMVDNGAATVSQIKDAYPQMFAKNNLCQ